MTLVAQAFRPASARLKPRATSQKRSSPWNTLRDEPGTFGPAPSGPIEGQQPAADNHGNPHAERSGCDDPRRPWRFWRRAGSCGATIGHEIERSRVESGNHHEQQFEVKRWVVDVLIRLSH